MEPVLFGLQMQKGSSDPPKAAQDFRREGNHYFQSGLKTIVAVFRLPEAAEALGELWGSKETRIGGTTITGDRKREDKELEKISLYEDL